MKASYEVLTSPFENLMSNLVSPYFPSFLHKDQCPIFKKKGEKKEVLLIY